MPVNVNDLRFKKTPTRIVVEGKAAPGATIKVENLSTAPFKDDWNKDKFTTAKADAQGNFRVTVKGAVEGDQVRLTVGGANQVVTVAAGGKDTRRAEFNVQSLRLTPSGEGYALTTVSRNPTVGEPGEKVQLTNQRTQARQTVTLDDQGLFPKGFLVQGEPGDTITFATTDGRVNADYKDTCGNVVIPARRGATSQGAPFEPQAMVEDRAKVKTGALTGSLFVDGLSPTDPTQGQVGDCYLVATAASLAQMKPEALEKMIRQNADGTFTVTFKRWDAQAQAYLDDPVTVTNSFPQTGWGEPFYGANQNRTELWFPVLEKAYAAWKGGYDAIRSGYPYEIWEASIGKPGKHYDPRVDTSKRVFDALKAATERKVPMVAWTGIDSTERPFTNTGLVADHAYTVLGVSEKDGQKLVQLRNPWACTEPSGDGRDDGVFELPWAKFMQFYDGVGVAE